jgi:Ca-activated chloride channel homolog
MNRNRVRTLAALALQLAALVALGLALTGRAWLDPRREPRVLVLLDRSQSVPRVDADRAFGDIVREAATAGVGLRSIEFALQPTAPAAAPGSTAAAPDPSGTNIEAALESALVAHAQEPLDHVIVISDGLENAGDALRALTAAREARLPVQWVAVGRAPPPVRIAEVLAPDQARVGQPVRFGVQLAGALETPLRLSITARLPDGDAQTARIETAGSGHVTVDVAALRPGPMRVDVALQDPASGRIVDALTDGALVDVLPRASILYGQGSAGLLAGSLARAGWSLNVMPATKLDSQADGLDAYQAVVLDDVSIADAGPRFWDALVAAVRQRGLGLLVLGGERSFARGGYRGSTLESVLPVWSEPAALDEPASIVFAVDKSGSMGRGSSGVDRFQLAQRAVQETARGLTGRDSLGLVVFDVLPRVLVPLGPADAGGAVIGRAWPASPNGGTLLAPALDAAIAELERAGPGRRLLVLVTDGFVDAAPPGELRARLERARIDTVALAVGPDADAGALERLFGADAGLVLRVNEAAELPLVMRSGLERRRARVERGRLAVEQHQALPFPPGTWSDWPAVRAHLVTRARPEAVAAVQSQRGEPLIAFHKAGSGPVLAVTSGLGVWTPDWLAWRGWPALAGGLAGWVSGAAPGAASALTVADRPGALSFETDVAPVNAAPGGSGPSITVEAPAAPTRALVSEQVAPGRLRATLPDAGPGLYAFTVSTANGTRRHWHLRSGRAESEAWGTNPALAQWKAAGLVTERKPGQAALVRTGEADLYSPPDRSLVGLALALFLAGVLVDRTRPSLAGAAAALRRWRARVTRPQPAQGRAQAG